MLRSLLRSHPNLTLPSESHFIPRFYRAFGDPRNDHQARRLARRILNTSWVRPWDIGLIPDDLADCRTYREAVNRLFAAWARREDKVRWGDKTPGYVTEIPTLLEIFPDAKIIHVVRDGRDVALSWLPTNYHPRNYYVAALLWRDWVSEGLRVGRGLPNETYFEVRYETLLSHLPDTMKQICAFLEEPYCKNVLRLTAIRRKENSSPSWQISYTEVVAGNTQKWKSQMALADRSLIESVAGDLLESLGYDLEGTGRPIPAWERLWWWVHQWMVDLRIELPRLREVDRVRTRLGFHLADARSWVRNLLRRLRAR